MPGWPAAASASRRCCSPTRSTRPAWPRSARPGGRATRDLDDLDAASRPLVDGIVGIGGRPGLRPDAVAALERVRRRAASSRSTCRRASTSTPAGSTAPTCGADLTVTFGTHKVAHLVDPGVARLRRPAPRRPRPRPRRWGPAVEALQPDDVRALLPRPGPGRAQVHPRRRRRTRRVEHLPRCGAARGRGRQHRAGRDGPLRRPARRRRHRARRAPRGRGRRPRAGLGRRSRRWRRRRGDARRGARGRRTRRGRRRRAAPTSTARCRAASSPRTPASSPRCSASSATRSRRRRSTHARDAARRWDCVVLLKGHHTLVAAPDGRVRVTTTGVPWLATAGAGDVLAGLVGSLLAAGLEPYDAASVGSWLHGAAATRGRRRRPADREPGRGPDPAGRARDARRAGMIAPMTDPVPLARRDRGRPRRHPAQRADPQGPRAGRRPRAADGRGQGRRLRPRHGRGRRGGPRRRRRLARRRHDRRGARAARGRRPRPAAVLAERARRRLRGGRRGRRRGHGVHASSELDEIAAVGRRRGCSSRSTPACRAAARRAPTGTTSSPRRATSSATGGRGSPASGRTSPRSDEPAPPGQRRAGGGLPRGARAGRRGRARPRGHPPRQLRGRDPAPVVALRPGPLRHRGLRPRPGARRQPRGSACGRR